MTLLFSTCWRGLLYTENIWNQLSCADGNTQQSCKRSNRTTVPSIVTEGKYSSVKCFNDREQRVSSWIVMTTFSWQGLSAFLLLMAARCDFIFLFFRLGQSLVWSRSLPGRGWSPTSWWLWRKKETLWFLQQPSLANSVVATAVYSLLPLCQRLTSRGTLIATDRCKLFCLPSRLVVCKAAESYADVITWRWALDSLPCLTAEVIS